MFSVRLVVACPDSAVFLSPGKERSGQYKRAQLVLVSGYQGFIGGHVVVKSIQIMQLVVLDFPFIIKVNVVFGHRDFRSSKDRRFIHINPNLVL